MIENKFLDTSFDVHFKQADSLAWLPWVGDKYLDSPSRLLVVGESHYHLYPKEEIDDFEKGASKPHMEYTRDVVIECPIEKIWKNKTYDNLQRVLVGNSLDLGGKLWRKFAFYNFVQREMNYQKKERPEWVDFCKGWETFVSVAKILEPQVCLFVGVAASNSFQYAKEELGLDGELVWGQRIGSTYAREGHLNLGSNKIHIICIQHCGTYFSWTRWRDYLNMKIPDQLARLTL